MRNQNQLLHANRSAPSTARPEDLPAATFALILICLILNFPHLLDIVQVIAHRIEILYVSHWKTIQIQV